VSAPKNAKVSRPRERTATGSPGRALNVPAGTSRRSGRTPTSRPAATSAAPARGERLVRPARTRPVPAATATALARRPRWADGCSGGPSRRSDGQASAAEASTSGSSPRNTQRQLKRSATRADTAGPTSPGTTQAVDSTANTRGRSASG
jgi:hypothetical protein